MSRLFLIPLAALLFLGAAPLPNAQAAIADQTCPEASFGTSLMAEDGKSILACLKDDSYTQANKKFIWKSMAGGGAPKGTVAFFFLSSCPSGWSLANGANGTIDVRGEFIRAWDAGRGADAGRGLATAQGDAIRNITGTFGGHAIGWRGGWGSGPFTSWNSGDRGSGGNGSGTSWGFDASRVVPTANENRPRNVALLACQKT